MTEHPEFYKKNEKGEIIPPVPDWADVAGLDYEKPAVRKYIIENFKSWIRDYDLDGFRCDVALFIPTDFWEEARAEVDKVKANTIWLAEAEKADLLVKAFDVDYSWNMHGFDRGYAGRKASVSLEEDMGRAGRDFRERLDPHAFLR
ncbi:MAG: hypothetical protein IPP63_18880 [Chloracidobacterium sp.]|nr:hypothetical protein [Chloracidobacterium sp.]